MNTNRSPIHIVGAGLSGSECAWQLAERGHEVVLYEMRSQRLTPAHKTADFAELVCSNSFGSTTDYSAPGQLKWEAAQLNSLILKAARDYAVPAGMALSVDRELFARQITQAVRQHPRIKVVDRIVEGLEDVPRPAVIATGPLTDMGLSTSLQKHFGNEFLYFFDAIAPVIDADSIDEAKVFRADRFDKGTKDYLNCGMEKDQYFHFIDEIKKARKIEPKEFEKGTPFFSGCMPIEAMIERGDLTPRFGPMSPKGIRHPSSGKTYYAVVQLRQENREATAYNMVGFQTKMAYPEQQRVFRLIPGLEKAEFLKLGSIHRNLYIHSPKMLTPFLQSKHDENLFFAGQITGVEGYFDSTCIGLIVAHFLDDKLNGREMRRPPRESALGSLLNAITEEKEHFQPTNINFGLFPAPNFGKVRTAQDKEQKKALQLSNAKTALTTWLNL